MISGQFQSANQLNIHPTSLNKYKNSDFVAEKSFSVAKDLYLC